MTLAAQHVQATQLTNPLAGLPALAFELGHQLGKPGRSLVASQVHPFGPRLIESKTFRIPSKHDVHPATGHVGGHGDRSKPSSLSDDLGFPGVLLGV